MRISNAIIDANIRNSVFSALNITNIDGFNKINDRQYGILLTDDNGVQRYARVGVIVAEVREDMTAEELMTSEINTYKTKQAAKEQRAKERAEKAERAKEERRAKAEAKAREKEEKGE